MYVVALEMYAGQLAHVVVQVRRPIVSVPFCDLMLLCRNENSPLIQTRWIHSCLSVSGPTARSSEILSMQASPSRSYFDVYSGDRRTTNG